MFPNAAKENDGCSRRTHPGRCGSLSHWVMGILLWSPCGCRRRIDILTLKDNRRRLLPQVQQQSPVAMDEWERGQDCEMWKFLVIDLHVGG